MLISAIATLGSLNAGDDLGGTLVVDDLSVGVHAVDLGSDPGFPSILLLLVVVMGSLQVVLFLQFQVLI